MNSRSSLLLVVIVAELGSISNMACDLESTKATMLYVNGPPSGLVAWIVVTR